MQHKTILALIIGLLFSISCVSAATVSHSASQITSGSFQVGSYNFPGILSVGTNTLFVNSTSGNVGISTTAPGAKLDVRGNMQIRSGTALGLPNLALYDTTAMTQGVGGGIGFLGEFQTGFYEQYSYIRGLKASSVSGNRDGQMAFYTSSGGTDTERMRIDNHGNVGIGTTSPGAKLEVSGGETILQQQAWQTPTLLNSWANYGGSYNPAGYFKDSMGIVHLRGLVRSGTASTIFTLPVGYRPDYRQLFATETSPNVNGRLDVDTSGNVIMYGGSNAWFSLDGATFRAE